MKGNREEIIDIVADIRNKLTPISTLLSLLQNKDNKKIPEELIKSEIETALELFPNIVESLNQIVEISK